MTFEAFIPHWHPTPLNRLFGSHWATASRMKKADAAIIAIYCRAIPKATGKRRLSVEIVLKPKQRRCDPDAYHKSLCDALVKAKCLVNDSSHYVELSPVQYERGTDREWGTKLTLENICE